MSNKAADEKISTSGTNMGAKSTLKSVNIRSKPNSASDSGSDGQGEDELVMHK